MVKGTIQNHRSHSVRIGDGPDIRLPYAEVFMGGWWIDRVADMNMLKVYVPPTSINSSVGTTGLNNAH